MWKFCEGKCHGADGTLASREQRFAHTFFFVNKSLIKNKIFPKLKILDYKCPEYVQIVAWALREGFGITNQLFLLDCHDTAMKVITREHNKQLAYVNKRFRLKLRECESNGLSGRLLLFVIVLVAKTDALLLCVHRAERVVGHGGEPHCGTA